MPCVRKLKISIHASIRPPSGCGNPGGPTSWRPDIPLPELSSLMPAGSSRSIRSADPDIRSIRFTPHSKAGLVQQGVQSEGSFLASATPFFVRLDSFSVESLENLLCQWFFDLSVSRDGFRNSILWIGPQGMIAAFSLKETSRNPQVTLQVSALHPTSIFS